MRAVKPPACALIQVLCFCAACFGQAPLAAEYENAVTQAREMQSKGDLEGITRTLSPWIDKNPNQAEAQHLLGVAYYHQQNYAGAIRHLSVALKLEPENSAAWRQTVEALGMAYYFSNRSQDALPLLERAVSWNQGDTYFLYALAMSYVYGHDWDSARRTFAGLFDIPPDGPQAFVLAADFLIREKFTAEAEKLILDAQKKRPDLPDLNYRLGLVALTNGAVAEAAKYLEKELAINPMHPMAWHYLGYIHVQSGKPDQAIKALQRSIWLNLRSTDSYVLIADAYMQKGKFPEAEDAVKRALELAPQNYEARFLLARIYHKTNRPELAKKEMAIASKLRSESEAKR